YDAGDVVVDPIDGNQYRAQAHVSKGGSAPSADAMHTSWALAGTTILNGNVISLTAFAGSVTGTASNGGSAQKLSNGGDLIPPGVDGFAETGSFTAPTGPSTTATCSYATRDIANHKLTGLSGGGCTGSVADGATVKQDIIENGSGTGFAHAGLDLEFHANVNVHGDTHITAVGDVTLGGTIDVTATSKAAAGPDKGHFDPTLAYHKGAVGTDTDGKRYAASSDVAASTTHPKDDTSLLTGHWSEAKDSDAAVAATFVLALSKSQLSGTSSIKSTGGNVSITSNVKTSASSSGDAELGGSGAGVAIAVFVTDSEAYVDSKDATPIEAKKLTLAADTDNNAPTDAKASPKGEDPKANNSDSSKNSTTNSNSPTQGANTTVAGTQPLTNGGKLKGASASGFVPAGTLHTDVGDCTYTSLNTDNDSSGNTSFYFTGLGGTCIGNSLVDSAKVFGDSQQAKSANGAADGKSKTADNGTGDQGNQNFNAALAVIVLVSTTQAYIAPSDPATIHNIKTAGADDLVHAGSKNAATATGDAGNVKFWPDIKTVTAVNDGTGSLADGTYYYEVTATFATGESLPSAEKKVDVSGGGGNARVFLTWSQMDGATGYKIYRGTASGKEELLKTVTGGGTTSYSDLNQGPAGDGTPDAPHTPNTADPNSGVGIGVAVTVGVVNTKAWLANNANITAKSVTVETTAPGKSVFKASATSGAGGSSVGVAGSIAVNVLVATTSSDIEGPTAVALHGAALVPRATSHYDTHPE